MKEYEFIPIGDPHFNGLNTLFAERGNDLIYQGINNILAYGRKHGVKTYIFLGDIFDGPFPEQADIITFLSFIQANSDLTFRMILGNHDRQDAVTHSSHIIKFIDDLNFIPNFRLHVEPCFERVNGIPFYFLPWPHSKHVKPAKCQVINIAHLAMVGSKGDNGRLLQHAHELEQGEDYWVIGDVHGYQRPRPDVIYPGTFFQTDFGEHLPKGFVHSTVKIGKRLRVSHKFIPMDPPFKLVNLVVTCEEDLATVTPDPLTLYKLFIKTDLILPSDYRQTHPNVVQILGYKTKTDLKTMTSELTDVAVFDRKKVATHKLRDFLKDRQFTKPRIARAREIVNELIKTL